MTVVLRRQIALIRHWEVVDSDMKTSGARLARERVERGDGPLLAGWEFQISKDLDILSMEDAADLLNCLGAKLVANVSDFSFMPEVSSPFLCVTNYLV